MTNKMKKFLKKVDKLCRKHSYAIYPTVNLTLSIEGDNDTEEVLCIDGQGISEPKYTIGELRHIAVNFAITCEKGYTGSFDNWFKSTNRCTP